MYCMLAARRQRIVRTGVLESIFALVRFLEVRIAQCKLVMWLYWRMKFRGRVSWEESERVVVFLYSTSLILE